MRYFKIIVFDVFCTCTIKYYIFFQVLTAYSIDPERFFVQQKMLALMVPGYKNESDIVAFFQKLHTETREQFPGIMKLLQLLLVVPATSATAERSFSMLRRIKTYLRSTYAPGTTKPPLCHQCIPG